MTANGELASVTGTDFAGRVAFEGVRITATLEGNADVAAMDALDMLLDRLHAEAMRLAISETVIDLRHLEFMNSSCFKSFVTWISGIQDLEPPKQYRIKFLSNPQMHWQKRSLHALRCFAVQLISVES
jgi:hypothetical protein